MKPGIYPAWQLLPGDRVASGAVVLDCTTEDARPGFVLVKFRRADGVEGSVELVRALNVETV